MSDGSIEYSWKNRVRPAPMRLEDAVAQGLIRVVTDPKEIAELTSRESHKMGHKNHTDGGKSRIDDDDKYSDMSYTIDAQYRGMF